MCSFEYFSRELKFTAEKTKKMFRLGWISVTNWLIQFKLFQLKSSSHIRKRDRSCNALTHMLLLLQSQQSVSKKASSWKIVSTQHKAWKQYVDFLNPEKIWRPLISNRFFNFISEIYVKLDNSLCIRADFFCRWNPEVSDIRSLSWGCIAIFKTFLLSGIHIWILNQFIFNCWKPDCCSLTKAHQQQLVCIFFGGIFCDCAQCFVFKATMKTYGKWTNTPCVVQICVSLSLRKLHESVETVSELQRTGFSNTGIGHLD